MTEPIKESWRDVAFGICDALGLDPKITRAVTIKVSAKEPVRVVIEQRVTGEPASKLRYVLRSYELVPATKVEADVTAIGSLAKEFELVDPASQQGRTTVVD